MPGPSLMDVCRPEVCPKYATSIERVRSRVGPPRSTARVIASARSLVSACHTGNTVSAPAGSFRAYLSRHLPPTSGLQARDQASVCTGLPEPLGASFSPIKEAVNFAVYAAHAAAVTLCLFTEEDLAKGRATREHKLDPAVHRTGDIWHVLVPNLDPALLYGFRVGGADQDVDENSSGHRYREETIMLDPYTRCAIGRRWFGGLGPDLPYESGDVLGLARTWPQFGGVLPALQPSFDWEGDTPLHLPMEDLIIYEMHVRGFTQDQSSQCTSPGTYLGLLEKLDYLHKLGVNAIELQPVQEFNELEYYALIPGSEEYRFNFWGYSTSSFFAPMSRYSQAALAGQPGQMIVDEFKLLVRECHKRGIEVILDVVFNHTAEGNEMGPHLSFRGLDNRVYYMLAPAGEYYNYSGCGNTLNCNHPVVRRFIVDCLRYWVEEMHVDGFRFDLASILTRAHSTWQPSSPLDGKEAALHGDVATAEHLGILPEGAGMATGTPLTEPALIEMISEDPVLRDSKLIAEAWDCDGLNQVGAFPHFSGRWAEWNGHFRDTTRQFIKGTDGPWASNLAAALCGSPHTYATPEAGEDDWWGSHGGRRWRGGRNPFHSVNFITAHDGFTLADLVSFNDKHNEANGEGNRDGEQHNLSWNCGEEGETQVMGVQLLRARQMRNLAAVLLLAHGVPMVLMGDEYGHSKGGNNNTYCHDSQLNWFNWDQAATDAVGFGRFFRCLVHFRRNRSELRRHAYVSAPNITWHGALAGEPDWSDSSRLVAYSLSNASGGGLYVAFNSSHQAQVLQLPAWPGRTWRTVLDTGKVAPFDFLQADDMLSEQRVNETHRELHMWTASNLYAILPYSCVVLDSVPEPITSLLVVHTTNQLTAPKATRPKTGPDPPGPADMRANSAARPFSSPTRTGAADQSSTHNMLGAARQLAATIATRKQQAPASPYQDKVPLQPQRQAQSSWQTNATV